MAEKIKIGGELDPRTPEKILGDASTIKDRTWEVNHPNAVDVNNYKQDEINEYLYKRIDSLELESHGDIQTDDAPEAGSVKLVRSGGTYTAIQNAATTAKTFSTGETVPNIGITSTPTNDTNKLVTSKGVKDAIENVAFSTNEKVNTVGIDSEPTVGSKNLVESGGVRDSESNYFTSVNLINNSSIHENTVISTEGTYNANDLFDSTDILIIESETNYVSNVNIRYILYFDNNKNIIRRDNINARVFETIENAKYCIISFNKISSLVYQLNKGNVLLPYSDYNPILKEEKLPTIPHDKLKDNSIEGNNIKAKEISYNKLTDDLGQNIRYSQNKTGYIISAENVQQYNTVTSYMLPIPVGTKIKNTGIKILISSFYGDSDTQMTLNPNTEYITEYEIGNIQALTNGNVELIVYGELVSGKDTDFVVEGAYGTNIFDSSTVIDYGFFIKRDGTISFTGGYGYTDYIEIDERGVYCNWVLLWGGTSKCSGALYDENKEFVSSIRNFSREFFLEYDPKYKYVRFNLDDPNTNIEAGYMICRGEKQAYTPFIGGNEIKKFITPTEIQQKINGIQFFLPKHIYVAAGRTIEIYYNQIILNAEKYNIYAICSRGKALNRKFQITASSETGSVLLTIKVYNDNFDLIAIATSTIHFTGSISTSKKILPIGASLVNNKPWLSELSTLSGGLITTVGTRFNAHEGRSGASVTTYNTVDGSVIYSFGQGYTGPGHDADIFSTENPYSIGDYVRVPFTFSNGSSGYRVYVYTSSHSPGDFDTSECYCLDGGNPFYDYINKKFSMNFYKTFFGINYDIILINIGSNGINLTPETNENGALGILHLIENIREEDATTPIIIGFIPFRSNQNGIGNQGDTDGYHAIQGFKFEEDIKVMRLAKAEYKMLSELPNVYLCPIAQTMDSEYDYGNIKTEVNPRLTDTDLVYELMPNDSVHPQNAGYMQMADEYYSCICGIINNI